MSLIADPVTCGCDMLGIVTCVMRWGDGVVMLGSLTFDYSVARNGGLTVRNRRTGARVDASRSLISPIETHATLYYLVQL